MRLGFPEVLVIIAILLVVFGANRLPELGRSMGKAIRGFKDATKDH
jgi:sec-independent protein translocase protein TatA